MCDVLFSIVGSYESTNWFSTNWITREDLPVCVCVCVCVRVCVRVRVCVFAMSKAYLLP